MALDSSGNYTLDATSADALSQGESITQNFTYTLSDNHGASSTAVLAVTVNGVNDGPVAGNDNASTSENTSVSGSVLGNDTDIDRLDTLRVTAVNGVTDGAFGDLDGGLGSIRVALASGAIVIMKSDGSFTYDTKGAFAALNTGQSATDSFEYTLADNHGGTDIALVSLRVDGVSDVIDPPPSFLFNHGSGKNDHGFFPKTEDKVNWVAGFTGNDTLKIAGYGDAKSVTFSTGDFNYGDPSIADTKFVIWIDGNNTSTRTEDVGYLADYTGLVAGQVNVTGDAPPPVELFFV